MTRHIEAYRYEVQHSDDADLSPISASRAMASGERFPCG